MALPSRALLVVLLLSYVAFLAFVLTQYAPAIATDVVASVGDWLRGVGVPATLAAPVRVEFMLNVAMFVPLALLSGLAWPHHPWANWVVYAFLAALAVELYQGFVLPPRSAQFADVVANTSGALVGAASSVLVALPARRRAADHRLGKVRRVERDPNAE